MAAMNGSPREDLVSLARNGAYVLLLDRETGTPICEPTCDPDQIGQAWDDNRNYRPRPALAATKRSAAVQPPSEFESWWPPKGWKPGLSVLDLPPSGTGVSNETGTPFPAAETASQATSPALRQATPRLQITRPAQPAAPREEELHGKERRTIHRSTPTAPSRPPKWVSVTQNTGTPIASFSNAIEYLRATCEQNLWLNTMSGVVMLEQQALSDPAMGRLRDQAERHYGIRFSAATLGEAAIVVAEERKRSPVQEYLRGLRWDGVTRVAQLAATLCAHPPTGLDQAIVRCFAIQAIARAMEPGCKADSVLILHGGQGAFKSMALRAIAGPFFSDGELPENARDQGQLLRLSWIHELAEIDRYIRARDSSTMKAMITRQEDAYRPPYARAPVIVPRSFVLAGTVNEDGFLTDLTGNRRFWLLTVPDQIDLAWIAAHRDALWAEAFHAYQHGNQWWFDAQTERANSERNADYLVRDDLDDLVAKIADGKTTTTVIDLCTTLLARDVTGDAGKDQAALRARADKSLQHRIGAALHRCGWQRRKQRIDGKPQWVWTREE